MSLETTHQQIAHSRLIYFNMTSSDEDKASLSSSFSFLERMDSLKKNILKQRIVRHGGEEKTETLQENHQELHEAQTVINISSTPLPTKCVCSVKGTFFCTSNKTGLFGCYQSLHLKFWYHSDSNFKITFKSTKH